MINRTCKVPNKPEEGYTGHCLHRSAATNLADCRVSFVNLKRHGQWKSDSVVKGYIADSEPLCMERLHTLITPTKAYPPAPETPKTIDPSTSKTPKKWTVNPYTKKKIHQTPDSRTQVFVLLTQGTSVATSDDENLDELVKRASIKFTPKEQEKTRFPPKLRK